VPSDFVGVGHIRDCTAPLSVSRPRSVPGGPLYPFRASLAVGVGNVSALFTAVASPSDGRASPILPEEPPLFVPYSAAVGVGSSDDPDAASEVRGADVGRTEHRPFRIEPCIGQVSEYVSESPVNETWNVLQDDVPWSRHAYCSDDGGPEVAVVVGAESFPGETEWLAGESCCDDIALLRGNGPCVRVDRYAGEPFREDLLRELVDLA
jgi:hypothetical protein